MFASPLVSCNFVAPFYKDLARFSRTREKKTIDSVSKVHQCTFFSVLAIAIADSTLAMWLQHILFLCKPFSFVYFKNK
jgi:hypothetical protein